MTLGEITVAGGGLMALILTLIQIAPVKLDPWSALARAIGRAINAEVLAAEKETRALLDAHITQDAEAKVSERRIRILRFNNELCRNLRHTEEEYDDILSDIDYYEAYCRDHKEYSNNKAVHAIANIGRSYDERLVKHDFLEPGKEEVQ